MAGTDVATSPGLAARFEGVSDFEEVMRKLNPDMSWENAPIEMTLYFLNRHRQFFKQVLRGGVLYNIQ